MRLFLLTTLPFADTTSFVKYAEHLGINLLMIAGGFVAGLVITQILVLLTFKYWLKKQLFPVRKFLRYVGGVAGAILIALLVCTWNLGGVGGQGGGGGDGDSPDRGLTKIEQPIEDPPEPVEQEKPETGTGQVPEEQRAEVTIVGGDSDSQDRYYILDDGEKRLNFDEVKFELRKQIDRDEKPLKSIIILFSKERLPRDHVLVSQLVRWAETSGLGVNYPPVSDRPRS